MAPPARAPTPVPTRPRKPKGSRAAHKLTPAPTPRPFEIEDEETTTFLDELTVIANTAEVLDKLGAARSLPNVDAKTLKEEKELLKEVVTKEKKTPGTALSLPAALGAAAFLRSYGQTLALDVATIRSALTNKLLELADSGDPRVELKAIELLGKHSDISLFTERSEITVNYTSPEELEKAIKERVKRLLGADSDGIEITSLAEELGMVEEAEFTEVEGAGPEDPENTGADVDVEIVHDDAPAEGEDNSDDPIDTDDADESTAA